MKSPNSPRARDLLGVLTVAMYIGVMLVNVGCGDSPQEVTQAALEATPFPSPPVLTLKVIPLSSPTSSSNEDSAYAHLHAVMHKYATGDALRLLDSYEPTSTWDDGDIAWVYDNALAMLASLARATATDWERSRVLADSLVYAQSNDPAFADGRVRDAYSAASLVGTDGKPQITSPGSATGNMAWTMLAWLGYWEAKGGTSYLDAATQLGQWIYDHTYDTRGAGGYMGGYSSSLEEYQWKATEHNIDVYVAFIKLYQATGDLVWFGRAGHARDFVRAMWNEAGGYFWTGTVNDGVTINPSPVPADTQTWGLMALGETDTYGAGITEETSVQWWDAVDYIGVDAYYPLTGKDDPSLSELKATWVTPTLTLENLSTQYSRRIILTEIGYRSIDGANQRPWEWQAGGIVDLQEQADCYRATLETLWGKPWLRGIYWWYWSTDPDQGGPEDMDFTPHNKPAERVLMSYYRPSVYLPIVLRVPT